MSGRTNQPARRWAWWRYLPRWMSGMWPQWPLAAVLLLSGGLNVLDSLRHETALLGRIEALSSVARSLAVLGNTTQLILGAMLVLAGIGLLWRLRSAWAFSVLLVAVTEGVNLARGRVGVNAVLPALVLVALLVWRGSFNRRTPVANYLLSVIGILAVLAYGTFGAYLFGIGFDPPISDIATGFYYTMITLSTVGYGDITPVSLPARLFSISLLLVGLSTFAAAIVSTIGPAISGEITRVFNPGEKRMKPTNHVILVGEGTIATNTVEELRRRGIPFCKITTTGQPRTDDYPTVVGDASEETVLRKANVDTARMVLAAREDDGENAFIALMAKNLNPRVRVLAVASSARSMHLLKLARADLVFSPAAVGSRLLANLIEGNEISAEFQDLLEGGPRAQS